MYKGKSYGQYQTWEDGCDYKCECIDAQRGQYRCTDRLVHCCVDKQVCIDSIVTCNKDNS